MNTLTILFDHRAQDGRDPESQTRAEVVTVLLNNSPIVGVTAHDYYAMLDVCTMAVEEVGRRMRKEPV